VLYDKGEFLLNQIQRTDRRTNVLKLTGVMPALLTPFDEGGEVNLAVVRDLVEFHLAAGLSGFYILGSTGEGLLLSEGERRLVAETVVDQVKGRVPVVVHVGAPSTQVACDLASHAEKAGADATSSIPPFYFRVGTEGVREHYRQIGLASSLPFYIYNIPATTGVDVTVEIVQDMIAEMPTLRGMKYTSYDFRRMRQIIELDGGRLNVMSGPDEMMIAAQAMGADGAIGTTYNILPHTAVKLYQAFHAGDIATAQAMQARLNSVVNLFLQITSISAVKEIMRLIGFDCGSGRAPFVPLTEEQKGWLREQLEEIGFFKFAESRSG
jgi:N-acetylneuraminate lyase